MTTYAHLITAMNLLYCILQVRYPHLRGDKVIVQTYTETLYLTMESILKTFIITLFVYNNMFNYMEKRCPPPFSSFIT